MTRRYNNEGLTHGHLSLQRDFLFHVNRCGNGSISCHMRTIRHTPPQLLFISFPRAMLFPFQIGSRAAESFFLHQGVEPKNRNIAFHCYCWSSITCNSNQCYRICIVRILKRINILYKNSLLGLCF